MRDMNPPETSIEAKESTNISPEQKVDDTKVDDYLSKNTTGEINDIDEIESLEKSEPIKNKVEGIRRENEFEAELKETYPESDGFQVMGEQYLRDADGKIVKDDVTGEGRRIDFVVDKNNEVVGSYEVTSPTADKTEQTAKEDRIREQGGNYVRTPDGSLSQIPDDVKTEIIRRD